ncbi:MAG: autotransporter-associated beta strand repeat-containing protein [Verrucomicrobiota bacterium]
MQPVHFLLALAAVFAVSSLHATGLTSTGRVEGDAFGGSASLSGTTALVGEKNKSSFQGAAYIYWAVTTGTSTARTQNIKLTASDGTSYLQFGASTSLSGATALVGAFGFNGQTGAAYVFRDVTTGSGGTRTENLKLIASDGASGDQFGGSVSQSGTTALVGAQYARVGANALQGSAYVFRDVSTASGTRTEDLKLIASEAATFFGSSLSLSGSTAIVGANRTGIDRSGSAYVFRNVTTGSGGTRTEDLRLTASDAGYNDFFGHSVSQSGTIAIVGANGKNALRGAAYVFRDVSTGSGSITEDLKLAASDGGAEDKFGESVSLSATTALVGAMGKSSFTGAVYLYRDVTTGSGTRTQDIKLTASDAISNAYFGNAVNIDGDDFIIGSYGKDSFRGKAYVGSVSSMTTLDAGNASRIIAGISFTSQENWTIGQTTDANIVTLSAGDTARVTAASTTVSIGKEAGSDNNRLVIAGTLTANEIHIGSLAGNQGNMLQIGSGGTTGSVAGDIINHGNLTFNRSDASTHTHLISGTGTVTKLGTGTLTLTAASTYTGLTAINRGKLIVDGSIASSAVAINSSGTLSGQGTVGAVTLNSGGTISPGNSPGILNTGNEIWNSGGSYLWELNSATGVAGTNWDLLNITGTLSLDSLAAAAPFSIKVISLGLDHNPGQAANFDLAQNYSWVLTTASSGVTGFSADKFAIDTSGFLNFPSNGGFTVSQIGNDVLLRFAIVPEPSRAMLLGCALSGLTLLRLRGRRLSHEIL